MTPRFWITDPIGHRIFEELRKPEDGSLIDTVFGEAVVIRPPAPPVDMWICDLCSDDILVMSVTSPGQCRCSGATPSATALTEAVEWPEEDPRTGEPIEGTRLGPGRSTFALVSPV